MNSSCKHLKGELKGSNRKCVKLDTAGLGKTMTTTIAKTFYRGHCFEPHINTHPCQKSYTDSNFM